MMVFYHLSLELTVSTKTMDQKRLLRSMRILAVVLIISALNTQRIMAHTQMRTVEIVSLLATGMVLGALIFCISYYSRMKSKANETIV